MFLCINKKKKKQQKQHISPLGYTESIFHTKHGSKMGCFLPLCHAKFVQYFFQELISHFTYLQLLSIHQY